MKADCAIVSFFHCRKCMERLPAGKSPQEWARLNVGFTRDGAIQVWCVRHDMNVTTLMPHGAVTQQ